MLAEVHYGGRVTDDYDRRLLNDFTQLWFLDALFDEQFNFYKGYNVMRFETLPEYLSAIEDMPLKDPPQACGLHPNSDITYGTDDDYYPHNIFFFPAFIALVSVYIHFLGTKQTLLKICLTL